MAEKVADLFELTKPSLGGRMKYFVLAILVFSFLMVDHPHINHWRSQIFGLVGEFAEHELETEQPSQRLLTELNSMFNSFNVRERGYVESRIKDGSSALEFYRSTCESQGFNDKIRPYNLNRVCGAIEKYRADLDDESIRDR